MRSLTAMLAASLLLTVASSLWAQTPPHISLKPFAVTIRVFDPSKGLASGTDYVLPVDSPDAEHAVASTMANAASFTRKVGEGGPLPVAFTCVKVELR